MRIRAVAAAALLALSLQSRADAQDGAWHDFMPPTRRGATLVHDTARDRYVMFAGSDTEVRNDVWVLHADSTTWRKLDPAGGRLPTARVGSAGVYDDLHDRAWFYGGIASGATSSGLWGLDADPEEWLLVTGSSPSGSRAYAALVRDPGRDRLILYGGMLSTLSKAASPEVWVIAPYSDSPQWTRLIPAGVAPAARWSAIVVYDPPRDRLVVIGGRNRDSVFTDAWQLKFSPLLQWSQLVVVGDRPPARDGAIGVLDLANDRIVTFGGADPGTDVPNQDVWSYALTGLASWTLEPRQGEVPNELREACATLDAARGRIVVHGGGRPQELAASYATNETRALDVHGVPAWGRIVPEGPTPLPRYGAGAAVDLARDAFWMFGGVTSVDGATTYSDEMWRGSLAAPGTWRPIAFEGPRPEPRHEPSFVYDGRTNRALLFGGWNGGALNDRYFDDAWAAQLDSPYVWRPVATGGGPKGRRAQATAWDAARRALFLFGGHDGKEVFGDSWELPADGTIAWRRIEAEGPSPRSWASAVYDAAGDRMIVYGGSIDGLAQDEVWALTLSGTPRWSRLEPAGDGPGSRLRHAAIYDPARRRMLVWGGYTSDDQVLTSKPGVWSLSLDDAPTWTRLAAEGIEPPPATGPVLLYDARRDRMVAYGGSNLFDDLLPNLNALEFEGGVPPAWIAGAAAEADGVHLLWQTAADAGTPVTIEKRIDTVGRELRTPLDPQVGTWFTLASTSVEGDGSVAWRDSWVGAGGAYTYRLVLAGAATGEATVAVPGALAFAFHGVSPSPTSGQLALSLQSTGAAPIRVSMFDAAGRRVLERDLGILPGGPRVVPFDLPAGRRAGIYFLRVSQGGDAATKKIVVL